MVEQNDKSCALLQQEYQQTAKTLNQGIAALKQEIIEASQKNIQCEVAQGNWLTEDVAPTSMLLALAAFAVVPLVALVANGVSLVAISEFTLNFAGGVSSGVVANWLGDLKEDSTSSNQRPEEFIFEQLTTIVEPLKTAIEENREKLDTLLDYNLHLLERTEALKIASDALEQKSDEQSKKIRAEIKSLQKELTRVRDKFPPQSKSRGVFRELWKALCKKNGEKPPTPESEEEVPLNPELGVWPGLNLVPDQQAIEQDATSTRHIFDNPTERKAPDGNETGISFEEAQRNSIFDVNDISTNSTKNEQQQKLRDQ